MIRKLGLTTKNSWTKWALTAAMALPLAGLPVTRVQAQAERDDHDHALVDSRQQVASVEQLKTEALKNFKSGEFDKTSELIAKAASISHDPALRQMSDWVGAFQQQRQQFAI